MIKKLLIILGIGLLALQNTFAFKDNELSRAAEKELMRSMEQLKTQKVPPYFISYSITEEHKISIAASFGKIKSNDYSSERILDIDLRVGSYKFDNTHIIRGNPFNFSGMFGSIELPMSDDENAIRQMIWYSTDRYYKAAIERYEKALTNKAVKVAEEDTSADFSIEKPVEFQSDWIKHEISQTSKSSNEVFVVDTVKWAARLRKISSIFNKYSWLYDGDIYLSTEVRNKMFISSEGSKLQWAETGARLFISAKTKADDGMSLPLYKSYFAYFPEDLPSDEQIEKDLLEIVNLLDKLRNAPLASTFTGPAILSGEASGVFFHEIFGHRVEGHREKDPNSSQTFKQSVGKKILPEFIDVVFDPTIKTLNNEEISGFYQFDDEGVKAQKVVTVENGIFKNFLMSRNPIESFSNSNGHGRKQAGYSCVSRQSNLIVNVKQTVSNDSLRKLLIIEAKKQNKEYGLYFETVSGGFTFTSRTIPNAFNVTPLVVYKIYVDGRPDELVRGVDLIGTPLTTFANIVAGADDMGIFNGVCGAESGGVPVSACSPSLLVSTIEVQKKQKSQAKPPILKAP